VSLENGLVLNFDARTLPSNLESPSPARFTLSAHDGAVSSIDVNPHIKGCIVTGGTDKLVKVWNVLGEEDGGKRNVSLVASRDLGVVSLLSVLCPQGQLSNVCAVREKSSPRSFRQTILSPWLQRAPRQSCKSGTLGPIWALGRRLVQNYARQGEYCEKKRPKREGVLLALPVMMRRAVMRVMTSSAILSCRDPILTIRLSNILFSSLGGHDGQAPNQVGEYIGRLQIIHGLSRIQRGPEEIIKLGCPRILLTVSACTICSEGS
jgi:hypothetical protein